ncbi:M23 family metallopeptidase [Nocardioides jensenii]|uniref:M23 family metallopeptidase n=1 Tax=Nocardioides jensenii TaxID=1843 RepID=UPI0014704908|nr:M23 family metallopeptidase [Nocardioides jensenii]
MRGTTIGLAGATALAVGLAMVPVGSAATADPSARKVTLVTDYEMPFPCGQTWSGTSRRNHSPSSLAIDWNRADDIDDPVVASAPGVVTTADKVDNSGYGRWVVIDHGNGEDSLYAHLRTITVTVGQRVDQGMQIGTVGSTGNSTGAHLHFEERKSRTVVQPFLHRLQFRFGTSLASSNCVDVPVAGKWLNRRTASLGVYRRAKAGQFLIRRPDGSTLAKQMGTVTDEPVVGDWEGNGVVNPGVWTPATRTFQLRIGSRTTRIVYGAATDKPVAGDWDGDGTWEVGVRRPSTSTFLLRSATGSSRSVRLGDANDLPVLGDWDGDGVTDLGVYDQTTSRFTLRKVDDEGTVWLGAITFGARGDLPVAGDWDGNGRTDLAVWTPSTATFTQRIATTATTADARSLTTFRYGRRR